MVKPILVLALLAVGLAACGGSETSGEDAPATSTRTVTTTTTSAPPPLTETQARTPLVVYYLRDGRIAPARVTVESTPAVAHAALDALGDEPPAGYSSDVADAGDLDVRIEDGIARLDWGDETLSHAGAAQVVYTLTQFPTVRAVELPDGRQARRAAFEDVTPLILIDKPLPGDTVRNPLGVAGTASVYEATLVVELVQEGKVLEKQTVTASTGAPYRGSFSTTFETTAGGDASIVAFSPSAADGSEQHRVEVPIHIG